MLFCIINDINYVSNFSSRTGHMKSLSFKVVVIIMCDGHLDDKYKGTVIYSRCDT